MTQRMTTRNAHLAALAALAIAATGMLPATAADSTTPDGKIDLAIDPAHQWIRDRNWTAEYRLVVSNPGPENLTVDLTVVDHTRGWTLTLHRDVVHVPPHSKAEARAGFQPPADAENGDAGTFTVRATARGHANATDEASAGATLENSTKPRGEVRSHRVTGTAGALGFVVDLGCDGPGRACAALPRDATTFACGASHALPTRLALTVHLTDGGNRTLALGGSGSLVAGDVPEWATAYELTVTGLTAASTVTCAFPRA